MEILSFKTTESEQAIDITGVIRKAIDKSGVQSGSCVIYCPHTTAAIAINEGTDETFVSDLFSFLSEKIPAGWGWSHPSNSPAHIKSTLIGPQKSIPIVGGKLVLGTWQSVFLLDFDGPRERSVFVSIMK